MVCAKKVEKLKKTISTNKSSNFGQLNISKLLRNCTILRFEILIELQVFFYILSIHQDERDKFKLA